MMMSHNVACAQRMLVNCVVQIDLADIFYYAAAAAPMLARAYLGEA